MSRVNTTMPIAEGSQSAGCNRHPAHVGDQPATELPEPDVTVENMRESAGTSSPRMMSQQYLAYHIICGSFERSQILSLTGLHSRWVTQMGLRPYSLMMNPHRLMRTTQKIYLWIRELVSMIVISNM